MQALLRHLHTDTGQVPTMADRQTGTIHGQEYALDNLSDDAKTQL